MCFHILVVFVTDPFLNVLIFGEMEVTFDDPRARYEALKDDGDLRSRRK